MSLYNLIRTAMYSLRAYKLRIFLTMIGIIIGISSVSTVLSLGEGLKAKSKETFESADLNTTEIYYYSEGQSGFDEPFKKDQFSELEKIEGVEKVKASDPNESFFGSSSLNVNVSYFNKTTSMEAENYSKETSEKNIIYGRDMTKAEKKGNKRVITVSEETAKKLSDRPIDLVGKGITIEEYIYKVVGIYGRNDSSQNMGDMLFGGEENLESGVIPKKTKIYDEKSEENIVQISLTLDLDKDREKTIKDTIKKLEELNPELLGTYEEFNYAEMLEEISSMFSAITVFLVFVTGISLIVGGIGVMNIMYVSVTERRREIGIRRAIGAKQNSIMLQFLIEAIFITLIGGLIGIALGYGLSILAGIAIGIEPVLTFTNFLGASSISVITGLIFGVVPAYKASRLDPIKAIYK